MRSVQCKYTKMKPWSYFILPSPRLKRLKNYLSLRLFLTLCDVINFDVNKFEWSYYDLEYSSVIFQLCDPKAC